MKNIFYIVPMLMLAMFSCNDPYADSSYSQASDQLPAASCMQNTDSLNLSLWVDLLKYTDLFNTINLQADYTLFAPNNQAMESYLQAKGLSNVNQLNMDEAKLLVRYHTISGYKYSSVDFEDGLISDTTATGDYLSTSFTDNGQVMVNSEAEITRTVQATNAYIHVLNVVLTPVTETLWEKLQPTEYSIFKQAVQATGYETKLNSITQDELNPNGYIFKRKYRYTMFAVPNSVFEANQISNFEALVGVLNAESDYTSTTNALNKYVAYHLLNQQMSYFDLSSFSETDKILSKNINTMAAGQLINVSDKQKTLYINYDEVSATGIKMSIINRNCKNGVMHVVDGVMRLKSPKPTKIQWELTDFPELSSVIPNYRIASGSTTYLYYMSSILFGCYKSLSVPESRIGLAYILANKNDAVMKKSLYSDYLELSLGMFGWVEMQSPAIVPGKYNVYIEHFNPKRPSGLKDPAGKLSFIIDGEYVGSQVNTIGAFTTSDQFLKTLVGTVEFTETVSHKLRILSGDIYSSRLDCLTFEPITQ